jgi:hypothetical protein
MGLKGNRRFILGCFRLRCTGAAFSVNAGKLQKTYGNQKQEAGKEKESNKRKNEKKVKNKN